ncbi:ExeA family protein [Gimesia aquarii]|uniref:AAA+ ATPase domain-containing protein n=1 Tax=Gimesia aquarii TaxID=2527964 RepID=A0A517VYL0_9PLAN|nr:AAA family ATPase [Gimesia aquarii]QDT98085.1 hypothetical protein V144x_35690 [Gimesia aquarii]
MYETNFGFTDRPFTVSPSADCFFEAAEHKHVIDELLVTVSSLNGITILTGDAGTGKTAICRQLSSRLENQFQIQFIEHCNFPTVRALLQTLLYSLTDCYEKVSEQELRLALTAEVRSSYLAHLQPLLLIVDEAHLLHAPFLEELRVLSDISIDGKPALQLILSGQTDLEETLIQPALSSLNQRIGCQVFLDRMTRQESEEYIEYRIKRVTTETRSFFTEDAIKFITHVSDGLPRCLNQICDHCLMLAYVHDSSIVNESIAREAFSDLQQLPLHWNDPLPSSTPLEELRKEECSENSGDKIPDALSDEHEIDTLMEDRLNQLVESTPTETELTSDDSDWDSADLFSLGNEMEAIEIGGDSEAAMPCNTNLKMPQSEVELVCDDFKERTDNNHEALIDKNENTPVEATGEFVEIIDRYAAIDAGIDPATLPLETQQNKLPASRKPLQLKPPQFHDSAQSIASKNHDSREEPNEASPIESNQNEVVESSNPVGLIDEMIPHLEEAEKESEKGSIVFYDDQPKSVDQNVYEALAEELSAGDNSFEEILAAQVYEVCSETRKGLLDALNEFRNYKTTVESEKSEVDQLDYDVVSPDGDDSSETEITASQDEFAINEEKVDQTSGPTFRLDSGPSSSRQKSGTSHLKGPAFGQYKNLFSRLRRKQNHD